jgi:hypothetical protein
MKRPVEVSFREGVLFIRIRLYIDIRDDRTETLRKIVTDGVERIQTQSPYETDGVYLPVKTEIIEEKRPCICAVNVKVYEKLPVVRKRYLPWCNVSRAYIGSGRAGLFKLLRWCFGMPDICINVGGRQIGTEFQRLGMQSVVQHEFGHILGFKDKYNYRTMQKSKIGVQDSDVMFRTGQDQRFMGYQIRHLLAAAKKGRLPYTRI